MKRDLTPSLTLAGYHGARLADKQSKVSKQAAGQQQLLESITGCAACIIKQIKGPFPCLTEHFFDTSLFLSFY
jgi:hypothetical protein